MIINQKIFNRHFSILATTQLMTSIIDWILLIFMQFTVFKLTQSAFCVMLLFVFKLVPQLLINIKINTIIKKSNLNNVLRYANMMTCCIIAILFLDATRENLTLIYLLGALSASTGRFFTSATGVLLPYFLKQNYLKMGNLIFIWIRIAGMAIGVLICGTLISFNEHQWVVFIMFFLAIINLVLGEMFEPITHENIVGKYFKFSKEVCHIVSNYGSLVFVPLISYTIVSFSLGCFQLLGVIFVSDILIRPIDCVGTLFAFYAAGIIAGFVLSTFNIMKKNDSYLMLICLVLMCIIAWGVVVFAQFQYTLLFGFLFGTIVGFISLLSLFKLYNIMNNDYFIRVFNLLDTISVSAFLTPIVIVGALADFIHVSILITFLVSLVFLAVIMVIFILIILKGYGLYYKDLK